MDNSPADVSSCDGESLKCSETAPLTDKTLPITVLLPEPISDCDPVLSDENIINTGGPSCENCSPNDENVELHSVVSHSQSSDNVAVQSSVSCHDPASPVDASVSGTQYKDINPSLDNEVHSCAPVVTVGGATEEELKRSLEQRLGLVLNKLARGSVEDADKADDLNHSQSLQTVSDYFEDDNVDSLSESNEEVSACADTSDLVKDIVQEMDEVERYSYMSLVAYSMHQLFEFSACNRYFIFSLSDVHC